MRVIEQATEVRAEDLAGERPGPGWARACGGLWQDEAHWQAFLEAEVFRWAWWLSAENSEGRARSEAELRALRVDAFTGPHGAAHLELALRLYDEGAAPDCVTVGAAAKLDPGLLRRLGGWEAITDLWFLGPAGNAYPDMPSDEKCGATIHSIVKWLNGHAERRHKAKLLAQAQGAVVRGEDPADLLDAFLEAPDDRAEDATFGDLMQGAMLTLLQSAERTSTGKLFTGFVELDQAMGPLDVGGMTVIGGRPGDGKSSLALAMTERWAQMGVAAGYVSCEDPEDIVGARVTAMICDTPQALYRGTGAMPTYNQGQAFEREYGRPERALARASFQVGRRVGDVLRAMTRLVRRYGVRVVSVDYVQAIKGDHSVERRHEIRRIAAALKGHAARLGVPLVLASQLRRREAGKRPTMSDLRDAGELEEMAENVILLWREGDQRLAVLDKAKAGMAPTDFVVEWNPVPACVRGLARRNL